MDKIENEKQNKRKKMLNPLLSTPNDKFCLSTINWFKKKKKKKT